VVTDVQTVIGLMFWMYELQTPRNLLQCVITDFSLFFLNTLFYIKCLRMIFVYDTF